MTQTSYKPTFVACCLGYFTQAIVVNLTAILFVPLMNIYNLSYGTLGLLVFINFFTQIGVDLIFSKLPDKYGFRIFAIAGALLSALGFIIFALTPFIFTNVLTGFIIATVIFSAAGGLIELIISPIVNNIPTKNSSFAMNFMHSFYAWGFLFVILLTTLMLKLFSDSLWFIIPILWAIIPFINFILWIKSPIPPSKHDEELHGSKQLILNRVFILFLLAITFGGAAEVVVSQWASAFVQNGLNLDKFTGDLMGPCTYAFMLALGRVLYGIFGNKLNLGKVLIWCSVAAIICYLGISLSLNPIVSVLCVTICGMACCLMWPGTLILAAKKFAFGGAWMFAMLAVAGDIGAAAGPYIAGLAADYVNNPAFLDIASRFGITIEQMGLRAGILVSLIFPILTLIIHIILNKKANNKENTKILNVEEASEKK